MTLLYFLIFAVGIAVLWMGFSILERLPRWRSAGVWNYESKPPNGKTFAIWIDAIECSGFQFEAGMVNSDLCQLSFKLSGDAECNENLPDIKRATVAIFSDFGVSQRNSNIIGKGSTYQSWANLQVFLPAPEVYQLLRLLRDTSSYQVHAQGFQMETGEIKIDFFKVEEGISPVE